MTGGLKILKGRKERLFTTLSRVSSSGQLSKVVLGCVTDWQQETRGLFPFWSRAAGHAIRSIHIGGNRVPEAQSTSGKRT